MSKVKHAANAAEQVAIIPFSPLGPHVQQAIDDPFQPARPGGQRERYLLVQCNVQNARYTLSAVSTPTATYGFVLARGNPAVIIPVGAEDTNPQFISETAGSILEYQWLE